MVPSSLHRALGVQRDGGSFHFLVQLMYNAPFVELCRYFDYIAKSSSSSSSVTCGYRQSLELAEYPVGHILVDEANKVLFEIRNSLGFLDSSRREHYAFGSLLAYSHAFSQ